MVTEMRSKAELLRNLMQKPGVIDAKDAGVY